MTLRILAGKFKGRKLQAPKGSATRPTQGIVREAVFNVWQREIQGARFLDLYAGSGAMGLEALSRGASKVVFVENHPQAVKCLRENIALLGVEAEATLFPYPLHRALKELARASFLFDLIYLDPPYEMPLSPILEELLSFPLLAPHALLFAEQRSHSSAPSCPPTIFPLNTRRFGMALLHQYRLGSP